MTDHHSHLRRLVESRADDTHRDHMTHFQSLAGIRPTLPSLNEAAQINEWSDPAKMSDADLKKNYKIGKERESALMGRPLKFYKAICAEMKKRGMKEEAEAGSDEMGESIGFVRMSLKEASHLALVLNAYINHGHGGSTRGFEGVSEDEMVPAVAQKLQREGWLDTPGKTRYVPSNRLLKAFESLVRTKYPSMYAVKPAEVRALVMDAVSEDIDLDELESELGEANMWVQGAIKRPGRLRQYFGVEKGGKIPMKKLVGAYNKLAKKADKSPEETSLMRAMALGIRLKGGDVPGGAKKRGLRGESADDLDERRKTDFTNDMIAGIQMLPTGQLKRLVRFWESEYRKSKKETDKGNYQVVSEILKARGKKEDIDSIEEARVTAGDVLTYMQKNVHGGMASPNTPEEIAKMVGADAGQVKIILKALKRKGKVISRGGKYKAVGVTPHGVMRTGAFKKEDEEPEGDEQQEALGVPNLNKWKITQKGGKTFYTIKLHGKTVTVSERGEPKGSGLYRYGIYINGVRYQKQDETEIKGVMRTVEKAVMRNEDVELETEGDAPIEEAKKYTKGQMVKLRLGHPPTLETYKVIRTYPTKADAEGPFPTTLTRLIRKGGGALLVELQPGKKSMEKDGGIHTPGPRGGSWRPKHYIVFLDAEGNVDGAPVDLKPHQYKRVLSYKEGVEAIADGNALITEDIRRFRVLAGMDPLPSRR